MEHEQILVDTSIFIDHLRKKNKKKSILYRISDKHNLLVSAITVFELYAGATDVRKINDVKNILSNCECINMTAINKL